MRQFFNFLLPKVAIRRICVNRRVAGDFLENGQRVADQRNVQSDCLESRITKAFGKAWEKQAITLFKKTPHLLIGQGGKLVHIGRRLIQPIENVFVHPASAPAKNKVRIGCTGKPFPNVQQETDILAGLYRSDRHKVWLACPRPGWRIINANVR